MLGVLGDPALGVPRDPAPGVPESGMDEGAGLVQPGEEKAERGP